MADKSIMDNLPEGAKHLHGALFVVPFESIQVPDDEPEGDEYKFKNPRLNTQFGLSELADKRLSAELRESIRNKTMLVPLVCRWMQTEDGKYFPHLVGGDRRYRAVDFLRRKKEIVADPRKVSINERGEWVYERVSATEAYENIACMVFAVNNDLDALALAWAENKARLNLTDGHEVAEVVKLRKYNAPDERILEILQRDEKWLAETDRLLKNLDDNTLEDLLENRMTRACAIELSSIENLDKREKIRVAANEAAQESYERKVARIGKQLESALDQREIAEGGVAEAEFHKDETNIKAAKAQVADAEKKVERFVKERDAEHPKATTKNVREAMSEMGEDGDREPPRKVLGARKVKAGIQAIDDLIASGGKGDGFQADLTALQMVRRVLNDNIYTNDPDIITTIKRFSNSKRKT